MLYNGIESLGVDDDTKDFIYNAIVQLSDEGYTLQSHMLLRISVSILTPERHLEAAIRAGRIAERFDQHLSQQADDHAAEEAPF